MSLPDAPVFPQIEDVAAHVPVLQAYYFVADTASATVNGMFLNLQGVRVGQPWTATVTTSTAQSFADMYAAAVPDDAVGAIFDTTQDLVYDITSVTATDAKANLVTNVAKHPTIVASKNITVGRVA